MQIHVAFLTTLNVCYSFNLPSAFCYLAGRFWQTPQCSRMENETGGLRSNEGGAGSGGSAVGFGVG